MSNQKTIKVIWNHTENAQQMISCEHWYCTQASYRPKDDHELTGYQQAKGEGRDVKKAYV